MEGSWVYKMKYDLREIIIFTWFVGILMILFPFVIAYILFALVTGGFKEKCKYKDSCRLYSITDKKCNWYGGDFRISTFDGIKSGCYIKMERNYDKFYK